MLPTRRRADGPSSVEAELNLSEKIQKLDQNGSLQERTPSWLRALRSTRLPLYDVHWPAAVVLPESGSKAGRYQVGLSDGRVLPLEAATSLRGRLKPFDVVRVKVLETRSGAARAELRIQPQVQGTAIVLENRTGSILAMAGGFSYASSQLNRATQTYRQPGSALKPVTYLAALANGLQPNTLVSDSPLTLPPMERHPGAPRTPIGPRKITTAAPAPRSAFDKRSKILATWRQRIC